MSRQRKMSVVFMVLGGMILSGCGQSTRPMPKVFKKWADGKSPEEVGQKVSKEILPRLKIVRKKGHHCEDAMWVFMARYAMLTKDEALMDKVVGQFDNILTPEGESLISLQRHVDHSMFGIVPLELYMQTQDPRCLAMGKKIADRQWEFPDAKGLSEETRWWIDDMYMITMLQIQAYRATGDVVYLDRAALEMEAYLDRLQRPNGLFYHGPDAPFFWARGNGWVAAGMTELLSELPEDHPRYARIFEAYEKMMASLLSYQDDDGMWHQLIDHKKSFKESSGTAMIAYAMIEGVKHGWLEADEHGLAARNSWLALVDRIDEQGRLADVCVGTGQRNDLEYYLTRPTRDGGAHGQAAMIWCIVALL